MSYGHSKKVLVRFATATAVLAVLLVVAYCAYLTFFAGVCPGPSLVEELQAGSITSAEIASIEILRFDVRKGWPFSEEDYNRMARKQITSRNTIAEFVRILKQYTTDVSSPRNKHPSTLYDGIVRVELVDGGHYYIYYQVMHCDGKYYTRIRPSSKGSTNPNAGTHMGNRPFVNFLQEHDPWYRGNVVH